MRASVWSEYEREYRDHIGYKADPLEWLASNWQGAAIGSLIARRPCKRLHALLLFVCLLVCLLVCFLVCLFASILFSSAPSFPLSFLSAFLRYFLTTLLVSQSFLLRVTFSLFFSSSFHVSILRSLVWPCLIYWF